MGKLNELVDFFVEESVKEKRSPEQKRLLKQALTNTVLAEVKEQLTAVERQKQTNELQRAEKAERLRLKRERIAAFIVEALFLALIVGLIVNQLTNLIEQVRLGMNWSEIILPVVLIFIGALIITWFLVAQIGIKLKGDESLDDE